MSYHLGVDLGTTFTAAAVSRGDSPEIVSLGDRSTVVPSVLYMKDDGAFLVGAAAERQGLASPDRLARQFKRRVGDPTPILLGGSPWSPEALTAELLRWVIERVSERQGGPPDRVALTHPANWRSFKIDLLGQAMEMAGLSGATLISEPEAAALHWSSQERVDVGTRVVVYDLGGGTFDVAILEKLETGFRFLGSPYGIEHLGGLDFDAALLHQVRALHEDAFDALDTSDPVVQSAAARLRDDCNAAKETLSSDTSTTVPLLFPGLASEVRINRSEFEATIRPSISQTLDAVDRALERADLQASDIDSVLLVGGSSRIPLVSQMVGARLARPVSVDTHPKHAIALGAALVLDLVPATPASPTETAPPVDDWSTGSQADHVPDPIQPDPLQAPQVHDTTSPSPGLSSPPPRLIPAPFAEPTIINPGPLTEPDMPIVAVSQEAALVAVDRSPVATEHLPTTRDQLPTPVGAPDITRRLRVGPVAALLSLGLVAVVGLWWFTLRGGDDGIGDAPDVAWQFETSSALSARPVVAGNTLVIGATTTNRVHAINTQDGSENWSFEADGGVSTTAAVEDGVVFVGSFDGTMHALDLESGSPLWQADLESDVTGGSLVVGDLVFVGTKDGAFHALDRPTGEIVWTAETDNQINTTPALAAIDEEPVIVVGSTDGGLYAFLPETGELVRRTQLDGGVWFSSPLVVDRPGGDGQELWVGSSRQDGGDLNRVILDSGQVQTFSTSGGVGTNPAITNDGLIVAGTDAGELFAVDQVTLGEVWREGYAESTQIKGSPAIFDDLVIFGTHGKELIAVDDEDGIDQWRFTGEQIFGLSGPTVEGERLYVGNDSGTVYAFDIG